MVSQAGEEDSTTQKRDLQCADVDIYPVLVPRVCPYCIGHYRSEQSVEVEEEEGGQDAAKDEED